MSTASWYVNGAPPGWAVLDDEDSLAAESTAYEVVNERWHFEHRTQHESFSDALLPLGEDDYTLQLAPFEASRGDLLAVDVSFTALQSFEGRLAGLVANGTGGGASGEFGGWSWFGYWDSAALYPPVGRPFDGAGSGAGGGGAPGDLISWQYEVIHDKRFVAGSEAAVAGLTTASYILPGERQCNLEACTDLAYRMGGILPTHAEGICGIVCAHGTAKHLQQLSWRQGRGQWAPRLRRNGTVAMPTTPFSLFLSGHYESVRATLDVNLSCTYIYRPFPSPPSTPEHPPSPSPSLPMHAAPGTATVRTVDSGAAPALAISMVIAALALLIAAQRHWRDRALVARPVVRTIASHSAHHASGDGASGSSRCGTTITNHAPDLANITSSSRATAPSQVEIV
jgi:hypothetical protein